MQFLLASLSIWVWMGIRQSNLIFSMTFVNKTGFPSPTSSPYLLFLALDFEWESGNETQDPHRLFLPNPDFHHQHHIYWIGKRWPKLISPLIVFTTADYHYLHSLSVDSLQYLTLNENPVSKPNILVDFLVQHRISIVNIQFILTRHSAWFWKRIRQSNSISLLFFFTKPDLH